MSRKFYARTHGIFTLVIEEMYEVPCANEKDERGSTFTFIGDLSYFASVLLTHVNFTRLGT